MKNVAFMGLGIMGGGMARQLLAAGFAVTAHNRSRERAEQLRSEGAKLADTPRQAAENADVLISMVADDKASRSMWLGGDGALAGARPGAVCVESSTLSPGWVKELAASAAAKGCAFLDAPVTGSRMQAQGGQLYFLVGGDAKAVEQVRPVLEPMSRGMIHLGPVGSGATVKLINNFMCGIQAAGLAEALAVAEKLDIDVEKTIKVLTEGAPGSPLVKVLSERMMARNYDPHFDVRLMAKDLSYAANLGGDAGIQLRAVEAALSLFRDAAGLSQQTRDMAAVVEALRKEEKKGAAGSSR